MKWPSLVLLPALVLAGVSFDAAAHNERGHHGHGHRGGYGHGYAHRRVYHHDLHYAVRIHVPPPHAHGYGHRHYHGCSHYPRYGVGFGVTVDGFSFSYHHGH